MTVHLPILSVSEVRTRRRCAREHQISYRLGYRPTKKSDALRFGTLSHHGLEAWWLAVMAGLAGDALLLAAITAIRANESDPFELVKAEELMRGYHYRWQNESFEVLGVEVEFTGPLLNPESGHASKTYRLGGKIDAIVRGKDGLVYIVEHKTSSEDCGLGSNYWRRLRLDAQVSTYFVGARLLGHEPAGCIYDVVKKIGIRPLKATPLESRKYTKAGILYATQRATDETVDEYRERVREAIAEAPEAYFVRGIVVRLESEERDAAFDTWQTAIELRDAERGGRFPRNPDACIRFGNECSYFGVCSGEASLEDPNLFRKTEARHEELSTPKPHEAA